MSEQVAKNLRRFREMLGWTQEHLAEAAGLSARTVQRAERDGELGAETMQALAAVFDVSVADLQRPWPTDDEVRTAIEEAAKRYKQIPLTLLTRASDLRPFMGADAWQVDHVAGLSEQQEDEIAVLEDLLRDYGDLWSDIGPTERRDAVKTIFESVDRLQADGLCVAAGLDEVRLLGPGFKAPLTMEVLRVLISSASQPQLTALREKNRPIRFA